MRTFPDVRMRGLLNQAERAGAALGADDYPAAKQLFRELIHQLEALGLESGSAWLALAIAHDNLEEFDMAFNSILKSLALDPLAPPAQRSFDIIVGRVRDHLGRLPVKDPSVPRLYALLQQSGEVDVPSHLVMARHYAETGRREQAEALFEALTVLAPASCDAWMARAQFARSKGDLETAVRFEAEAKARAGTEVPYGIPTDKEA